MRYGDVFAVELEVAHDVAFSWLFISDGEGGRRKGSVSDAEFETIQLNLKQFSGVG